MESSPHRPGTAGGIANHSVTAAPFVSIVVPTRARPQLLKHALASVVAQGYPHESFEIIVVDDSDNAEARKVVDQLRSASHVQLRYVDPRGNGVNHARNEGARLARGDLIVFIDDDVEAPLGWLEAWVEGFHRHGSSRCLGGPIRLRVEGRPPRLCDRCRGIEFGTRLEASPTATEVEFAYSANMAITRAAWEEVGPFDERLRPGGDEVEWQMRFKDLGGRVVYVPDAWLWHRRIQSDLTPRSLMRARFHRAANSAYFDKLVGNPTQNLLRLVPISLGHSVRRGCWNGVFMAAAELGNSWGLRRHRKESPERLRTGQRQ